MHKIGEFSRIAQVTVKTLHYYDRIGLLKPAHIDRFTKHRYYSMAQLVPLNRILALKEMGVSLEQIQLLLAEDLSLEAMQGIFRLKQAELQATLAETEAQLQRVQARLTLIEQEQKMPAYDVITKKLESQIVASLRQTVQKSEEIAALFTDLHDALAAAGITTTGAYMALYYNEDYRDVDLDVEVAVPVGNSLNTPIVLDDGREIIGRALPGHDLAASTIENGHNASWQGSYAALGHWLETHHHETVLPTREIYLSTPDNPEGWLIEIQFPVQAKQSENA